MEFLDPDGQGDPHVHRHAGRRRAQAAGRRSGDDGPRRPPDPHPPVAAGLNRLTWDMRYPGATDFPG